MKKEKECAVCNYYKDPKHISISDRKYCPGVCKFTIDNYCYFLPTGGIETTKPKEHIENIFFKRKSYEVSRSLKRKKTKKNNAQDV